MTFVDVSIGDRILYNLCPLQVIDYILEPDIYRVGSHVVSVRIHCTEKWRTSFHTDVLSKSK